jgi:uncharacterized OB-fold protein
MSVFIAETEIEAPYVHATGSAVSRFFTALRDEGVILGRQCARCKKVIVPARDHCETCGRDLQDFVPVGPEGRLMGLAIMREPMPGVGIDPPFAFVRVRLDGASVDLIHLAKEVEGLVRGARVRAVFAEERSGTIRDIEHFALAGGQGAPSGVVGEAVITAIRTHLRHPFRLSSGALVSRFQDAVRGGEIRGNRCTRCRAVYTPPVACCPRCWARCEGWERVSDRGTVTSFVVVNVPFYGQEIEIPYVLAHIALDGADSTLFHLVVPATDVEMGMRVQAVWRAPRERKGFINDDIDHFERDPS